MASAECSPEFVNYPPRWQWDEGMRAISGFGGGYELACLAMIRAGGEWVDAHPDAIDWSALRFASDLPKEMQKAMTDAAEPGGATGAMMGACAGHIAYVARRSWEKCVDNMRAALRDELEAQGIRHG